MAVDRAKIAIIFFLHCIIGRVCAWFVTTPTQNADWQQLASLISRTWSVRGEQVEDKSLIGSLRETFKEKWLEQDTYKRYVCTARRMRGAKYALLVVKEWGSIIGVAEMGMQQSNNNDLLVPRNGTESFATVGMICVDERYRGRGIANALVERCEVLASTVWNETLVCADVEPHNEAALRLFQGRSFEILDSPVIVSVRRLGKMEERPHVRLRKEFQSNQTWCTIPLTKP